MVSLVMDKVRMTFEKSHCIRQEVRQEKQKITVPVRGMVTYKQNFIVERLRNDFCLYNLFLSFGFFDYYVEKTNTHHCAKISHSGMIILGRTNKMNDIVAGLPSNSFSRNVLSGENIFYNSYWNYKKPILVGAFVTVEIARDSILDIVDFHSFIEREAHALGIQDFVLSIGKKVIVDFFSERDISMKAIENIFKVFSVVKYIYIILD